ncbi:MAG TPA: hypothetical protein PLJ23_11535 [Gemmatimonadales bacterium]|nr:hypothetical protein [Gemmatimonadales bacterium]
MAEKPGNPIFALLLALAVAGCIVFLLETLSQQVMPLPEGIDPLDPVQLKAALEAGELPWLGMGLVLGGWLLGAYAGGRVVMQVARREWVLLVFAGLFTAVVVSTLMAFPHPTWMWLAGPLSVLVGTWLGMRLGGVLGGAPGGVDPAATA